MADGSETANDSISIERIDVDQPVPGVNCCNAGAIYTRPGAGFQDTGRIHHGGACGQHHVFAPSSE